MKCNIATIDNTDQWDLTLFADWPVGNVALAVGDIDGDGNLEVVTGGEAGLAWLRPRTGEHGVIQPPNTVADGGFHCGVALCDIDGDGIMEVVAGTNPPRSLWCFKAGEDIALPWKAFCIDPETTGAAHDVLFADIDGDGRQELVCNAMYSPTPGLFIYRPGTDIAAPWEKHQVQDGAHTEWTSAADVDGDGIMEIAQGPFIYHAPPDGPFAGLWLPYEVAPGFREFCRTAFVGCGGPGRRWRGRDYRRRT